MSIFSTITKGMADGAETLQANFAKLASAISNIADDGTMTVDKLNVGNLGVNGDARNLNVVTNPNLGVTWTSAANGLQNGTYVIRVKNGWVSIAMRWQTTSSYNYAADTLIGTLDGTGVPLPWGTAAAVGTVTNISSASAVGGVFQIKTNGEMTLNTNNITTPANEYMWAIITYPY